MIAMPAAGLAKFDLGTVPASVTPPRTWRRAAWFAVISSTGVLVALIFASVSLVGPPSPTARIDALPGIPSGIQQYGATGETTTPTSHPAAGGPATTGDTTMTPSSRNLPAALRESTAPTTPERANPAVMPPSTSSATIETVTGTTTTAQVPPPTITTEPAILQRTNPEAMSNGTRHYFANVARDPAAASAMTSGKMRSQGSRAIKERYAEAESVEVRKIVVDPADGSTTSVLKIRKKDGSTVTAHRELRFTSGDDPTITDDRPA